MTMKPILEPDALREGRPEVWALMKNGAPALMTALVGEQAMRQYEGRSIRDVMASMMPGGTFSRNAVMSAMGTDDFRNLIQETVSITALAAHALHMPEILKIGIEVFDIDDFFVFDNEDFFVFDNDRILGDSILWSQYSRDRINCASQKI